MVRCGRWWAGLVAVVLLAGCDSDRAPGPPAGPPGGGASLSSNGPPSRVFDPAALEAGVRRVLTESFGIADVTRVHCPSGQIVQAGISFDCAVMVGGEQKSVTLMVRSADGTYVVSPPE